MTSPFSLFCTLTQHGFHIFNNHSAKVHIFGNQLDYVPLPLHARQISTLTPSDRPLARNSDPNVGLHNPLCLLRLLLHAPSPNTILHACLHPCKRVCLRHIPSCIPPSSISPVQSDNVRWSRALIHHPDHPRHHAIRIRDADVEDESRLDGAYDGV